MSPINGDFDQLLVVLSEDNTTNSQQEKQNKSRLNRKARGLAHLTHTDIAAFNALTKHTERNFYDVHPHRHISPIIK